MTNVVRILTNYHIEKWQTIGTAPKGKKILLFYKNSSGSGRIIIGFYVAKHSEEIDLDFDEEFADYCEDSDTYFYKEGWVEWSWNCQDCAWFVLEDDPIHWMPLPESPVETK